MNLLNGTKILSEKIENLSESVSREEIIRKIQPMECELVNAVEQLHKIYVVTRHFRSEKSMDFDGVDYLFTRIRRNLELVRNAIGDNPEEALKRNRWANCESGLRTMVRDLEQELKSAWKDYIEKMSHDIGNLELFLELGDGPRGIREIKRNQERLTTLGQTLPVDNIESSLNRVNELSLEIGKLVVDLDLGDLPDNVKWFIKRVKSITGATLADLDMEVFEWLKNKNKLNNFKIK